MTKCQCPVSLCECNAYPYPHCWTHTPKDAYTLPQKSGYSQRFIAKAFIGGRFGLKSGTDNYYSESGALGEATLWHYRTIEAIRTRGTYSEHPSEYEGQIGNNECRGYAFCSYHGAKYSLPLTTLSGHFDIYTIRVLAVGDWNQTTFTPNKALPSQNKIPYYRISVLGLGEDKDERIRYEVYVYSPPVKGWSRSRWMFFIKDGRLPTVNRYYGQQTDLDPGSRVYWFRYWWENHIQINEDPKIVDERLAEKQRLFKEGKIYLTAFEHPLVFKEGFNCEVFCDTFSEHALGVIQRACVKCGGYIHNLSAINEAYKLKLEHGLDSGALCCGCYSKLTKEIEVTV